MSSNFVSALKSMKDKVIQIVNHRRAKKEKGEPSLIDVMVDAEDLYRSDQQVKQIIFKTFSFFLYGENLDRKKNF